MWTYDFVADRTIDGGALKWLTLVDEYTRECLALHVDSALTGADVRRVLARVIGRRGAPTRIRSDNGSEFICEALAVGCPARGRSRSRWRRAVRGRTVSSSRSTVASGTSSWSVRSSSRWRMRRRRATWFRREFNTIRPHSGLAYKTPKDFSDECDRGLHGQPPRE